MREYPFSRERVKFPSNKKARIVSLDRQRRFVAPIRPFPQRSPLVPSKYSRKGGTSTLGLLNTSQFSERQSHLTNAMNYHKLGACSKRPLFHPPSPCTPRRAFPWASPQGFGARSVHEVREGERREERQACEREADKGPRTLLADPAPTRGHAFSTGPHRKEGNLASRSQTMTLRQRIQANP